MNRIEEAISHVKKEWETLKSAPLTFLSTLVVAFGAAWFIFNLIHSSQVNTQKSRIDWLESQLTEYRNKLQGASPIEVAKSTEDFT